MFNIYNGYKIAVVKDIRKDKFRPHITTCCNTWGIKATTVCSTDQVLKTLRQFKNPTKHTLTHSDTTHHCTEHFALRHKLKLCTDPFLYRSDLVTFRRMLYLPDVCNCTMPYVHRTVPAVCRTVPCLDSRSGRSYTCETRVVSMYHKSMQYKKCFLSSFKLAVSCLLKFTSDSSVRFS